MRMLRTLMTALVLAAMAAAAGADSLEMANLVPSGASAVLETADAAGLRTMLLESKFWATLEKTQACREWRASNRYREMQERVDRLLANLEMTRGDALQAYLGGRSAVVLLPSGDPKKPYGVVLTECTSDAAGKLVRALGGIEVDRYRDVPIWEIHKDNRVDRMALVGPVLLVSGTKGNELEQVIDAATRSVAVLGDEGEFAKVAKELPAGWRARAYVADIGPLKLPGAVAMYPQGGDRVHFEWRIASTAEVFEVNAPVALKGPSTLPSGTVAAVASVLHPQVIWEKVQAHLATRPEGQDKILKAKMFVRGWFPGQSMEGIVSAFGPEAAGGLVKSARDGAPGLVGLVRLTAGGRPAADAFRNGLGAKAMILSALGQNQENKIPLNVREETYANAALLIIEAPGVLDKILGDWAKDIGLVVAVTDDWLIVGSTPESVKQTLDTAAGNGKSLAAELQAAGQAVPAAPTTRWGVLQPASSADIVLAWAERLLGKERFGQAKKMIDLAELMNLVKRMTWQRTDEPDMIRGTADIQAVD